MEEKAIKILVVDDEKIFRNMLLRTLQSQGYEVSVAADGRQGLELIESRFFDIVITDLNMPHLGGLELMKHLRERWPETIIIIITGFATLDSAMTAIKKGAYDYITKPFQIEEILHAVLRAKEKIYLIEQNRKLISQLERAYLKIRQLLGNKAGLVDQIAEVDRELKEQSEALKEMFELKRYQSELDQRQYLSPPQPENSDLVNKLQSAVRLRDEGVLSDSEFRRIKTRLLE